MATNGVVNWTIGSLDGMAQKDVQENLKVHTERIIELQHLLNGAKADRDLLMARACMSEFHRTWARPQDDLEHAFHKVNEFPGYARSILPPRRIPWSEQGE